VSDVETGWAILESQTLGVGSGCVLMVGLSHLKMPAWLHFYTNVSFIARIQLKLGSMSLARLDLESVPL